jgi:cytochrome P450
VEPLVSLLADLFMAGSETTSGTISFCLLRLVLSPDVQRRAQEQIDKVVGRSRLPSLADRQKYVKLRQFFCELNLVCCRLPYVEALIMEVQRISVVAATTAAHRALQPCNILGHHIPQVTLGNLQNCEF